MLIGCGIYRAGLAAIIGARGRASGAAYVYQTAIGRVGGNTDSVIPRLWFKVSHQGTVTRHGEGVFGLSGSHLAAIHPINKSEIRIGRGGHSAGFPFLVEATPRHRTAVSRVGRNTDGINPSKVGHKFAVAGNMEIISGIVCNYTIIFRPIGEPIPRVGYSMYRAILSTIISALRCSWSIADIYRAAVVRVSRNRYSITPNLEMRRK